ncbi:hypothetical protein NL154_05505 [Rhizobium sp. YTUHZ044]|uniref:hypothetical protein n=1 Tax=Rhizobium sp. YTUHZ044 TaxID=2962678 RepID=UPI003DA8D272
MKHRITFEVDKSELFDMLHKMNGDFSSLGVRLVEQLLQSDTSFLDALGIGVYGVSVVSRSEVEEPPAISPTHAS